MKLFSSRRVPAAIVGAIFIFITVIDRLTKVAALAFLGDSGSFASIPEEIGNVSVSNLSWELVINRGISWGLFSPVSVVGYAIITGFIALITMLFAFYGYRQWAAGKPFWGEFLIVVGSASNLVDRVLYHGVIDFIRFSWGTFSWPVFNCADCYIVIGAFLMVLQSLKKA
jgi:signal peptidase II